MNHYDLYVWREWRRYARSGPPSSRPRLATVRLLSDVICRRPGITPAAMASLFEVPLDRILGTLRQLARSSIRFSEHALFAHTPLTPVSPDAEIQLQRIASATGLDIDAPLTHL